MSKCYFFIFKNIFVLKNQYIFTREKVENKDKNKIKDLFYMSVWGVVYFIQVHL